MEIKTTTDRGVTVMHVDGNIDSSTYEAFQTKADELIKGGARYFLIDLTKAPFVSSAGLRALNILFNRLRSLVPDVSDEEMRNGINAGTYKSPHLKLLNPSKQSMVSLESSGFTMFIEVFTDLETAIESF